MIRVREHTRYACNQHANLNSEYYVDSRVHGSQNRTIIKTTLANVQDKVELED